MNLFLVGRRPALPGLKPLGEALAKHAERVSLQPLESCRIAEGFVLADGREVLESILATPGAAEAGLAERSFLLNANRWEIDELLESHGLAGGIDKQSLFAWRQQTPGSRGAYWLHGRRAVTRGLTVPARISGLHQTARYCAIGGELFVGLPDLIVRYLKTVQNSAEL